MFGSMTMFQAFPVTSVEYGKSTIARHAHMIPKTLNMHFKKALFVNIIAFLLAP